MNKTSPRIGAVVLAGGAIPPTLAHLSPHRALLQIHDRYLLEYLLETLHAAPSIGACAVVAPAEALPNLGHLPGCCLTAAGESLVENMQRGACALHALDPTHVVYITGDIPLLTVEGVQSYLDTSLQSGAELTYPIIPRDVCEARFPGAHRTYVRLTEGTFTGGNAIFTVANLLRDKAALIQSLYAARKHPVRLAQLLGFSTVFRLLTGTLDLPHIETVATRLLDAKARAIITPYAEIGFDVDKLDDLRAVERALAA